MSLVLFLQIFFVCLLGAMSPGPSMIVVINNAVFKNRIHGIYTSIGHGIGISIYAVFAVVGISFIIETNVFIFESIKILSIIFLIYLGVKSLKTNNKINFNENKIKENAASFFQGFSISILNPKIFTWFVAFYSQFMSVNNEVKFNVFLVLIAGIVDTCWYILLTILVTSGISLNFIRSKSFILQKVIGSLFITIGLLLLINILLN